MVSDIKRGLLFAIVTMVLFGAVYHLLIWGIGRVAFPNQAEGSLVRRADGSIVGSSLIAQAFTRPEYFHPRPSGVDYNAASSGGSRSLARPTSEAANRCSSSVALATRCCGFAVTVSRATEGTSPPS